MRARRGYTWSARILVVSLIAATAFASSCDDEDDDTPRGGDAGQFGNDSGPIVIRRDGGQTTDVDASRSELGREAGTVEALVDAGEPSDAEPQPGDAREDAEPQPGDASEDAGEDARAGPARDGAASPPQAGADERDAAPPEATADAAAETSDAPDAGGRGVPADAALPPDGRGPADGAISRFDAGALDARSQDASQGRGDGLEDGGPDLELAGDPPSN